MTVIGSELCGIGRVDGSRSLWSSDEYLVIRTGVSIPVDGRADGTTLDLYILRQQTEGPGYDPHGLVHVIGSAGLGHHHQMANPGRSGLVRIEGPRFPTIIPALPLLTLRGTDDPTPLEVTRFLSSELQYVLPGARSITFVYEADPEYPGSDLVVARAAKVAFPGTGPLLESAVPYSDLVKARIPELFRIPPSVDTAALYGQLVNASYIDLLHLATGQSNTS